MEWQETMRHLRFQYHGEMAAQCQNSQASRLLDSNKAAKFPTFYDWLLWRGFNRWQLSARGIGRDIEA
jgi:hypothetical protein